MPAQRRKKKALRLQKARPKFKIFFYLVIFAGVLIGLVILLNRSFWNGEDKITIVTRDSEDDVIVTTFDPEVNEIISISIPGETEVEVAKNLGVWKLASVWQLGYQEGEKGALLAKTVTRHFKFPAFVWADKQSLGLSGSSALGFTKAIFGRYDTNLGLGDKLGLAFFSLGIENSKRVEIHLEETGYLRKATLSDGTYGFKLEGKIPQRIAIIFADPQMSKGPFRINLRDRTGETNSTQELTQVLEVLGGKVSSITRESEIDIVCLVKSNDKRIGELIRNLFSCQPMPGYPEGNFDLEIVLGKKFGSKF